MTPTKNDRSTACRLLRRLREQRGWSWTDQALALCAVAGQRGVTAAVSAQLTSLQCSIALGAGSDFDALLTALAYYGVPAQRTRELRDLVVRSISSVPFVRLQLLLAPIVEFYLRLQDTQQLRARLGALRCDAYLPARRIAFETRDDAAARRWYARAVAASDDPTRRAAARTSYAISALPEPITPDPNNLTAPSVGRGP